MQDRNGLGNSFNRLYCKCFNSKTIGSSALQEDVGQFLKQEATSASSVIEVLNGEFR